jgi:hypothetical protein
MQQEIHALDNLRDHHRANSQEGLCRRSKQEPGGKSKSDSSQDMLTL